MKVVDAVEDWFVARAPRKDPPNTIKAYRGDLASVLDQVAVVLDQAAAEIECSALTLQVMRRGFGRWAADRAASSVRRGWSTWSGFFGHLVSEGIVDGSPMPGIAKPSAPKRQPKAVSREDEERLIDTVYAGVDQRRDPWPEMERAVILLGLTSGARSAEILACDVGDVSRSPGSERIRVNGKTGERSVPLPPTMLRVIEEYLDSRRARFPEMARQRGVADDASPWDWWADDAPLIVDRHGERMQRGALQYLVRLVFAQSGVSSTRARGALVHAMRHTKATRMAEEGATVAEIMAVMGHGSMQTSQGYIGVTAANVRAAALRGPTERRLARDA